MYKKIAKTIILILIILIVILSVIILKLKKIQNLSVETGKKLNYNQHEIKDYNMDNICFVAGIDVLTPSGFVNISELKVGDSVYSRNENTGEIEIKKVTKTFENDYDSDTIMIYTKDSSVEATLDHKFYTKNRGWIEAKYLTNKDILVNVNNAELDILKIERTNSKGSQKVYTLTIEDNHNYFIGFDSVLVHNHCCIDGNSLLQIDLEGNTKAIKDIQVGDKILTYNKLTHENELSSVIEIYINQKATDIVTLTFEDGSQLTQNMYHPIYTKDGWKSLTNFNGYKTLTDSDIVKTQDGYKKIKKIEINLNHEPLDIYSLSVENAENFYANGTLMKSGEI